MSTPRERILSKVKRSLGTEDRSAEVKAALEARLRQPKPGLIPQRGQLDETGRLDLFERMALEQAASVERLDDLSQVPAAVARYLKQENLPAELRMAPDPVIEALPWQEEPLLSVETGRAKGDDLVSLTGAFAAVAETGTLVLTSGPHGPTTLNFLPDTHIVVIQAEKIVGPYEDAVAQLRAAYGAGQMPRTVNFITGPSRTADIEQTIQLGAHGPRRLHILLVGAGSEKADG
jgi:L-lactate dehydrogenase complex protein LldG